MPAEETNDPGRILAGVLLSQVQRRDRQCAFWVISALSKLRRADPNLTVGEVAEFFAARMPIAETEVDTYERNT